MAKNIDEYFEKLIAELEQINHINPKDLPEIELYMDQVTTFMDSKLNSTKRHDDDKILTKTMINNYAKNDLLPPPVKKKYSKQHMLMLIYIYYLKNILSINDIKALLNPITDKYFKSTDNINMDTIYEEIYNSEKGRLDLLINDIKEKYEHSKSSFEDSSDDEKDFLQLFSFICSMAFDIYAKKHLIEQLIDALPHDKKKKWYKIIPAFWLVYFYSLSSETMFSFLYPS